MNKRKMKKLYRMARYMVGLQKRIDQKIYDEAMKMMKAARLSGLVVE